MVIYVLHQKEAFYTFGTFLDKKCASRPQHVEFNANYDTQFQMKHLKNQNIAIDK
jgi:hypothetical protein